MKLAIILSISVLTLLGCGKSPEQQKSDDVYWQMRKQAEFNATVQTLQYSQDQRTGLCFAMIAGDYRSLTYVPCSDAVFKVMMAPK